MDINSLIYSECHSPVKVKMYNGITNRYEYRDVPCGKCYHCKITRINEWVTRMVIQSNYSKYVYYGTLTYNGKRPTIYNDECLSIMSNFNKYNRFNDTPLILRKDHMQKFLKRLRKNTGIKIQYAYCGEYGSTYSRPHYHYIMWSDEPISKLAIYKAWSAPTKKDPTKIAVIGRIEHRDIKHDAYFCPSDKDNASVYKYVCKYIQKTDFKFEQLTNINQLKKCYETNFSSIKDSAGNLVYLQDERLDDYLKSKSIEDFDDFKKVFSPFFHCSKSPAIGYQYLQDHIGEFKESNFKLFGLSGNYIFPLYFIRKTKESLCPLKAQSETNSGATSYSRLPKMAALLQIIQDCKVLAESTEQVVQLFRYNDNYHYHLEWFDRIQDLELLNDERDKIGFRPYQYRFIREYVSFVNVETHVYYSFRGDYYAMYNTTTGDYIAQETIENVINLINYYYGELKRKILLPLYYQSEVSANKKAALIREYGGEQKFKKIKEKCVENLMRKINRNQSIYKQSKTFE